MKGVPLQRSEEEFEVAVVGAGPGGLATTLTLGSFGITTLVVDRRTAASTLPRATVASTGTMELLRRWGLEHRAWERSIDVEWQAWASETLSTVNEGEAVEVGLPTRAQARLISPTAPACIGQDALEPLLEEHLSSFPSARLERGVELAGLERSTNGGYALTLAGTEGRRRRVKARHVVGADGLRSKVRAELGITTDGSEGLAERIAVLFRAPIWSLLGEHRYGIYFLSEERSFLPAGKPDRWIFARKWDPAAAEVEAVPFEEAKRWIRDAVGDQNLPVDVERLMPVTFGVGLAERFRQDGAFLIGDAAHRVTPRGGTGMNTAMRDGFDLGWKLAWVLLGWAAEPLLDSYERERRPVAEFNTLRSTKADGSILGTAFGLGADIGGRIPHVWVERGTGLVSTLDLLSDGLTLIVGSEWNGSTRSSDDLPPLKIERLDEISARGVGLTSSGARHVRRDGHLVALWNGEEPGAKVVETAGIEPASAIA